MSIQDTRSDGFFSDQGNLYSSDQGNRGATPPENAYVPPKSGPNSPYYMAEEMIRLRRAIHVSWAALDAFFVKKGFVRAIEDSRDLDQDGEVRLASTSRASPCSAASS